KVSWHDFRYIYLFGEVGVFKNFSVVLTPTWLYGLEGPKDNYEKNVGLSDAWIGFKYQVLKGSVPMAFGFNHRTPYFYDLPGAYSRTLFDSARQPDDRFGASATNNFNRASYLKLGASAIVPFGSNKEWSAEVGYNQWVWGRSARRYKEPYVSLGRSF